MLSDLEELPSVQFGEVVVRFDLEPLNQAGREIAEKELRETTDVKAKAVEELKELLRGELRNLYFFFAFAVPHVGIHMFHYVVQ